jgi:hypothetical protein
MVRGSFLRSGSAGGGTSIRWAPTPSSCRFWISLLPIIGFASYGRSSDHPPVFPVKGQVFYDGRPAAGAVVVLYPVDGDVAKTSRPRGRADGKGDFDLATYRAGDGAQAGTYVVTVEWKRAEDNPEQGADLLPPIYGDPKTSPLRVTVTPISNAPLVLRLTAKR